MGFGGSVAAMITSLKNNARKRKTLYDNKGLVRWGYQIHNQVALFRSRCHMAGLLKMYRRMFFSDFSLRTMWS